MAFGELEENFNEFADSLREKGVPMPSMAQTFGMIALILVLIALVAYNPLAPKTKGLQVLVTIDSGLPLEKAAVSIYDGSGNIITEKFTDPLGFAIFGSVPKNNIEIIVRKAGFAKVEKFYKITPNKAEIALGNGSGKQNATVNATIEITLALTDQMSLAAIPDATITYAFSDLPNVTFKYISGRDGLAKFKLPVDKTANIIIEKALYETRPFSIVPVPGKKTYEIKMKKKEQASQIPTVFEFAYGTLRVYAKDEFGLALEPQIKLYDATTNSRISIKTATGGSAIFQNLLTHSTYYITASLEGYLDFDGIKTPSKIGEGNEIRLIMRKKQSANPTPKDAIATIFTLNEEGSKIPAKIAAFDGEVLIFERESKGEISILSSELENKNGLKIYASNSGMLPAFTEDFEIEAIPSQINLVLQSATEKNSAKLSISFKDGSENPIEKGIVKIFQLGVGLIGIGVTDAEGNIDFTLEKLTSYQIEAKQEEGEEIAYASIFLDSDMDLPLSLGFAISQIPLTAKNAVTGEKIEATFISEYSKTPFDSCFGTSCMLFAKTLVQTKLKVSAANFLPSETTIVPSGDGSELSIELVPSDYDGQIIKFLGIFSQNGAMVDEIEPNKEYAAKFLAASLNSERMGIYFRLGKSNLLENDIAQITGAESEIAPTSLTRGISFSAASSCANEISGSEFKWMNAEYTGVKSQEIAFKFKAKANAQKLSELAFFYRGYFVLGGEYIRIPLDDILKTKEKSTQIDWCKAKTIESAIPIKKSQEISCAGIGCLKLSLEQDGIEATENFLARSALDCGTATNPCDKAVLKIRADFAPNDPQKEFLLHISQKEDKLKFQSIKTSSGISDAQIESGISITLPKESSIRITANALPLEIGSEVITATITEVATGLEIKKSISFKITESCQNGYKKCDNGICSPICFDDPYMALENSGEIAAPEGVICEEGLKYCIDKSCKSDCRDAEELTPAPVCEGGLNYCPDGICRENCVITSGKDFASEIKIEIRDGKFTLDADKITMQIDAFAPFDAIPINFVDEGNNCNPLFSIVSEKTKNCYAIENNHLVFRGNELSQTCPLKSIGEEAIGDNLAKLRIACLSQSFSAFELPIVVVVKKIQTTAIQFQPRSLGGSAAKIFHILNQKQAGKEYILNGKNQPIPIPGAYTFATSKEGAIELTENGEIIDSISFTSKESFFENIDNQGGRATACHDYVCCASKWCTPSAAKTAFDIFKQTAKEVGLASVFRKGNDYLAREVIRKPFVFSTIIRLVEGAGLPPEVKLEDSPAGYGCDANGPKIYAVQASSEDGINWKYSARIERLYKFNYLEPEVSCPIGMKTPSLDATKTHGYFSGGAYLPLCNFLTGEDKCVRSEPDASLSNLEQVKSKRQQFPIPIPSGFWVIWVSRFAACYPPATFTIPDLDLPGSLSFPRYSVIACAAGVPKCAPTQRSFSEDFVFNNQRYAIIHVGLDDTCMPKWKSAAIKTAGTYANYAYPEYGKYADAIADLIGDDIEGDLTTCSILSAAQKLYPKENKITWAQRACSLYSQNKGKGKSFIKKIFKGGAQAAGLGSVVAATENLADKASDAKGGICGQTCQRECDSKNLKLIDCTQPNCIATCSNSWDYDIETESGCEQYARQTCSEINKQYISYEFNEKATFRYRSENGLLSDKPTSTEPACKEICG